MLLLATAASATTLLRWDTLELARRSGAIVQGHVRSVHSHYSGDGMRILTDIDVQVDSVWKGTVGDEVRIVQEGGNIEGLAQRVDGMASFTEGDEVVVFLDGPRAERYALTGMAQGKFRVDRSAVPRAIPESLNDVELIDPKTKKRMKPDAAPVLLDRLRAQVEATLSGPL